MSSINIIQDLKWEITTVVLTQATSATQRLPIHFYSPHVQERELSLISAIMVLNG